MLEKEDRLARKRSENYQSQKLEKVRQRTGQLRVELIGKLRPAMGLRVIEESMVLFSRWDVTSQPVICYPSFDHRHLRREDASYGFFL
ncbi:hypothetical protein TNCV_659281 [Trichonephila clavipes]|nr:hypothetical protein TNCV_659281 [Trichonephila clavipes]